MTLSQGTRLAYSTMLQSPQDTSPAAGDAFCRQQTA